MVYLKLRAGVVRSGRETVQILGALASFSMKEGQN